MSAFANPQRVDRAVARIAADRRSGASELAVRAVKIFAAAVPRRGVTPARYMQAVRGLARRLQGIRPTMLPIGSAVRRLVAEFEGHSGSFEASAAAHAMLRDLTKRQVGELEEVGNRVIANFESRFARLRRPFLISYSSRVTQSIRVLKRPHVTVCESRPLMEGRRTAQLLQSSSAFVALVTEAQIGVAMDDCDSVVMGCDAIHAEGSIVNKTGSYLLALAAHERRRPVIVLGDTYRFGAREAQAYETQSTEHVWRNAPRGIVVPNRVFEEVPARLIDYIVLETGVFKGAMIASIWKRVTKGRSIR